MGVFNIQKKRIDEKLIMIGAILDTATDEGRFLAMKQLFDIGKKKFNNPSSAVLPSEFTLASAGAVCALPYGNTAMYEQHPVDFLYSKNADVQYMPASVTKTMSVVTGLPYISNIGEVVTVEASDVQGGSGNYFSAGDMLTIKDIIYGMMLPSSNTCAQVWAHHIGKILLNDASATSTACISAFCAEMNKKAQEIGCTNSYFDSPAGASMTTLTTVSDLVKIGIAACSCNDLLRIWNKKSYTINIGGSNARTQVIETTVTNPTLENDYYIFGGKTGHGITSGVHYRGLIMVAEPKS